MDKSIALLVGHNGPRTGAWWQDGDGMLDEFVLAQRVVAHAGFVMDSRRWRTALYSMVDKYPLHLYQKGRALDQWRPALGLEIHMNIFSKPGSRDARWAGVDSTVFREGHVPIETDRASGVSVVFLEENEEARVLASALVGRIDALTDLGVALGDGLDPRPRTGARSIYLTHRVDPAYRRPRHRTPGWCGCPVVLLEVAALSHPHDREVLRNDPHIMEKLGQAIGEACDRWLVDRWSADGPA